MDDTAIAVGGLIPTALLAAGILPDDCGIDAFPLGRGGDLPWLEGRGALWIEQVTSHRPRSGLGRAAMAEVCMLADRHGCPLALNPWAQDRPDALRQDELERFYQSLGFGWRRDHVMVREPGAPTVVHVRRDVAYLPAPNRLELVFDATPPRHDLTRTSFVVPVADDGAIVMANNRRRGTEIPGGHVEPGETAEEAAVREGGEEAGVRLGPLVQLGHLRMTSQGETPPGWRYPHPLSYQTFHAARLLGMLPYEENDECLAPVVERDDAALAPHIRLMARRARTLLGVDRASSRQEGITA